MTTAFATLLICVARAAVLFALVAFLWVNRATPINESFDEYGRVPLFGVGIGVAGDTALDTTPDALGKMAVAGSQLPLGEDPTANGAAPISNGASVSNGASSNGMSAPQSNGTGTPTSNGSSTPAMNGLGSFPPKSNPRQGGDGWGSSPGWPTPPRSAPPVPPREAYLPPQPAANGAGLSSNGVPGSMIEGHNIRFSVPVEGTLQFLPGRLEISSGLDAGREIRFVRVAGPNGTEVTFGRNEGPLYRHIQLRDQTVSREHAKMTLAEGRWQLANLSRTNPVAHNGRVLGYGELQPLEDGDKVEMGEVVFSFRSR